MQSKIQNYKLLEGQQSVVIILNSYLNYSVVQLLSQNADIILCADGGANELYEAFNRTQGQLAEIIPTIIKGDLNCIKQEVSQHYQDRGSEIILDLNKNMTDLDKCIEEALFRTNPNADFYIIGSFGRRLDQTLSILSSLLKYQQKEPQRKFIMFGEDSLLRILLPGNYEIEIEEHMEQFKGAGLFPAGNENSFVTTKGFKWNLTFEIPLIFGERISSSNQIIEKVIEIDAKDPVFFITQLGGAYKSRRIPI